MGQDEDNLGGEQGERKSKGLSITKIFRPVTSVNTSIGIIYMYRLRVSDYENVKNISEIDAILRIRAFIPSITSLTEVTGFKDERTPPSAGEVSQLSDNEIEVISESYLKTISKKDSEHPQREPNESATSYLDRVLRHDAEFQQKTLQASLANTAKSSSKIFDDVRKSSSALGSTVDAFKQLMKGPPQSEIRMPDMSHIRAMQEQYAGQRRERAEELDMVRLTGQMTAESAKTLKDLAEAATILLEQLDERDRKSDESTRSQITIAVWSVGISALLALIALIVAVCAYVQDSSNIKEGDKWQTELLDAVREGNRRQSDAEKKVQQLREELTKLAIGIKHNGSSRGVNSKTGKPHQ